MAATMAGAASVLEELQQLSRMLERPADRTLYGSGMPDTPTAADPSRLLAAGCSPGTSRERQRTTDRLGRAIEAAEVEMEAALARSGEVHRAQLRQRELEVRELRSALAAKERALEGLRDTLAGTRREHEKRMAQAEEQLAARGAEASALQAELLALRAERDGLQERLQQGMERLGCAEHEVAARAAEAAVALRAKAEQTAAAAAAVQQERRERELLQLEVTELRRELADADEELRAAQQRTAGVEEQWRSEVDARRDLEALLDKQRAQAAFIKESKDLEIGELRRRLKAERGVRRACERWLKAELRSRGEMEALLTAVRDISSGKVSAEAEVQKVEALIDSMRSKSSGSGGSGGAGGGGGAERHQQEFAELKRALDEDSAQLKTELEAAKKLLSEKLRV